MQSSLARLAGGSGGCISITRRRRRADLHRLTTALRYVVEQGDLPLNVDGAAGWSAADRVWVVGKRALDRVRAQQEGHTGYGLVTTG